MPKIARILVITGMYHFPLAISVLLQRIAVYFGSGTWKPIPMSNLLGPAPYPHNETLHAVVLWIWAAPMDALSAAIGAVLMIVGILMIQLPKPEIVVANPDEEEGIVWN